VQACVFVADTGSLKFTKVTNFGVSNSSTGL